MRRLLEHIVWLVGSRGRGRERLAYRMLAGAFAPAERPRRRL